MFPSLIGRDRFREEKKIFDFSCFVRLNVNNNAKSEAAGASVGG